MLSYAEARHPGYQGEDTWPMPFFDPDAPLIRAGTTRSTAGAPTEKPVRTCPHDLRRACVYSARAAHLLLASSRRVLSGVAPQQRSL